MKKAMKKVSLNKETLRHLDSSGLEKAAGASVANSLCSACACSATYLCSGCEPCD
jgi:hypothetical protein